MQEPKKEILIHELELLKEVTPHIIRDCSEDQKFNLINAIDKEIVKLKTTTQEIHYSNCKWHFDSTKCSCDDIT